MILALYDPQCATKGQDEGDACNIISYDSQILDAHLEVPLECVVRCDAKNPPGVTKEYCHRLVVECYGFLCGMYFVQAGAASRRW